MTNIDKERKELKEKAIDIIKNETDLKYCETRITDKQAEIQIKIITFFGLYDEYEFYINEFDLITNQDNLKEFINGKVEKEIKKCLEEKLTERTNEIEHFEELIESHQRIIDSNEEDINLLYSDKRLNKYKD